VRAGATPEVVAAETGWPLDKVQRYADPPLAERAFIVDLAQRVTVPSGGAPLAELAGQVLAALGLSELQWDAFRRSADGRWVVTAEVPGGHQQAVWSYDPDDRNVHPQNEFARVLMGVAEVGSLPDEAETDHPSQRDERPHLVAVPPEDFVTDSHPRADTLTLDVPVEQAAPRKKSRSRRASVPSWDEILFGTQRDSDH
jgi:hypothetical protein